MRTCLIPPVPDLDRFIDRSHDHHLVLSHLIDDHPRYANFYSKRAHAYGDYVILDNGAKELGSGLGLETLLQHAIRIGAKEVVLSDTRYNAESTIELGKRELQWLVDFEGRAMYEAADKPRIMIVPQGGNPREWERCLEELLLMTQSTLELIDGFRPPVVAVAYHYDHMFSDGLLPLVAKVPKELDIHLLGWTRQLETLSVVSEQFPERVRSVDSSRPFVYAMKGLLAGRGTYPTRGSRYFETTVPMEYDHIARGNITMFKCFAHDWS
jgi:hypothetical protein